MYKSRLSAPFKPPRFTKKDDVNEDSSSIQPSLNDGSISHMDLSQQDQDIAKRRKIISRAFTRPKLERKPTSGDVTSPQVTELKTLKFSVQWRKRSTKKNKTWEGDGTLTCQYSAADSYSLVLKDTDGRYKSKKTVTNTSLEKLKSGILSIGQFEVEIESEGPLEVSKDEPTTNVSHEVPSSQFKSVLKRPNLDTSVSKEASLQFSLDTNLLSKLRPHQIEGVNFMYECIFGKKDFEGNGCLLADEMGLGKTLMTITVILALLQQLPRSKVLIVCPLTLVNNWKSEFKKWLGTNSKVSILTLATATGAVSDPQNISNFGKLNVYNVLIINYEKVGTFLKELSKVNFELLVCDEGHRLKSSSNKVLNHLNSLLIPKRILLTGTPIQNDLTEYYTIINFINPGILGDYKSFQKNFIGPILRSRDVNCFDLKIKKHGEEMSKALKDITKNFILRRTQADLPNYLTSKTDVILYSRPTKLQVALFQDITSLRAIRNVILSPGDTTHALKLMNLLRKICNSPTLLTSDDYYQQLLSDDLEPRTLNTSSGKINSIVPLLLEFGILQEKAVIVSNFTKTLDLLELVLHKINLRFSRLDGSTPNNLRQKIVNDFNRSSYSEKAVFLLSSKSGGVGINLVGASRLVLFDNDWNPAMDLQSMARIHRDGQKRDCFIYRLLTTGCIDEKIFQRQLVKSNLSKAFLDNDANSATNHFDENDLKTIFEIDLDTNSNTHDLLRCHCNEDGTLQEFDDETDTDEIEDQNVVSASDLMAKIDDAEGKLIASGIKALRNYKHILPQKVSATDQINDPVLVNIINNQNCPFSYIMTYENSGFGITE